MQVVRLQELVEKVTLLQTDASGAVTPVTLCAPSKKKRKKKRSSLPLGAVEMVAERMVDAQKAFADTYAKRFKGSQRKKKDGWLLDMGSNVFKATNKAGKNLYRVGS